MNPENLRSSLALVAVTDEMTPAADLVAAVARAVRGGATMVQLRRKAAGAAELHALARALLVAVDVPVIVNDDVAVALAAGAHGVHLGAGDLPPARVRGLVPAGFLIGASAGGEEEVALGQAADYWGVGPWRTTGTKADAGPALAPAVVAHLARAAQSRPWVAIGGVRPDDVAAVMAAGASGVAVVSGLFGAPDVELAARRYRGWA